MCRISDGQQFAIGPDVMKASLRLLACLFALGALLPPADVAAQRRSAGATKRDQATKLDKALGDTARLPDRPRVIVRYRAGQGERLRQRLQANSSERARDHRSVQALSVDLPAAAVAATAADPDVIGMSLDAIVTAAARPAAKSTGRS